MTPVVIILLLVAVLLYVLFSEGRNNRNATPLLNTKKLKSVTPDNYNPSLKDAHDFQELTSLPHIGLAINDRSEIFKNHLRTGIESIFSGKSQLLNEERLPHTIDNTHPDALKLAIKNISNLKNLYAMNKLTKSLGDPDINMPDLSNIIATEPVIAGKILRTVNSSIYGMRQKVNSISHAVVILGMVNIKNILYHEGFLQLFNIKSFSNNHSMAEEWRHATLTSMCASYLADVFGGINKGTLFTLGLLHDIGKFVATSLPQIRKTGINDLTDINPSVLSVCDEDDMFGINHAVIGKLVLQHWGLSSLMTKIVGMHHMPSYIGMDFINLEDKYLKYLLVLFLADQIAKLFACEEDNAFQAYPLDKSYMHVIDKEKILQLVLDDSFIAQMKEAELRMESYM